MKNKKLYVRLFFLLSLVLLVIAIIVGVISISSGDKKSKSNGNPELVTRSSDDPSEEPITKDNYEWKGKGNEPKYIKFNRIKIEGFIQKVTVDQRQEVGVPSNVNLGGWFILMKKPNETGLSVIDGHIDGKTKPGIFYNLSKAKTGDTFTIEFGSGKKTKFKVTGNVKVAKEKAPEVLFSQDPQNKSQLNLITCGGTFDKKARHYNDRIIVTSVPIN